MTFTELAWAAGLFEGEGNVGCFADGKTRRRLRCQLVSTDEDVVRRFARVIGVGAVYGPRHSGKANHKPYWTWTTTTFEAGQAVIAMLWRWLGLRRKAAASAALRTYRRTEVEARRRFTLARRCTPRELSEMRSLHGAGVTQVDIARRFNRSSASVSRLLSGSRKVRG